jgi:hypothetical protein
MPNRQFILLLLVVVSAGARAQRITPLHSLVTQNSLLTRPEVFRAVQKEIDGQWSGMTKGARLEILDEKMKKFREFISTPLSALSTVQLPALGSERLTLSSPTATLSLAIPTSAVSFDDAFEIARRNGAVAIANLIQGASETIAREIRIVSAPMLRQVFEAALNYALTELKSPRDGTVYYRLSSMFIDELESRLRTHITKNEPSFNFSDPAQWAASSARLDKKALEEMLAPAVVAGNGALTEALNSAEHQLRSAIDRFNSWLVAGDAGLSISEGENSLGAGITLAYTQSKNLQIGAFFNGTFQPEETAAPQALLGMQVRYSWNRTQIDLLASGIRGDTWGLEAGLGVSHKVSERYIAGIAFFNVTSPPEIDKQRVAGWSLAGSVRSSDDRSPTVTLGVSHRNGASTPLFQITYPITRQQ